MGESRARRARRAALRQEQEAAAAPPPAAAPQEHDQEADDLKPDFPDLDFTRMPGNVLPPERSTSVYTRPKTVLVSPELEAHIASYASRQGRVIFSKTTIALWRVLLREEDRNHQEAQAEALRTGYATPQKAGPIYEAVQEELDLMREERRG